MIIFAGPTLNERSRGLIELKQIQLAPPIQRGDLEKLLHTSDPGEVAIVDGYFHQALAVSHEEIMRVIDEGWSVTGLSSLGAIRAYELRDEGMVGTGKVYQRFLDTIDFQDDEVTLRHFPGSDYTALSEPLIHFRVCLETLATQNKITTLDAEQIIDYLKRMYFGDRTMELFKQKFTSVTGKKFDEVVQDFNPYRIKSIDLIEFLQNQ